MKRDDGVHRRKRRKFVVQLRLFKSNAQFDADFGMILARSKNEQQ
jgi:hypothetical protein